MNDGQATWRFRVGDAAHLPLLQCSVDLVMTSPPYEDSRTYGNLSYKLRGQLWVDWMVPRVVEACRVSRGLAFFVMAGTMRQSQYQPVVEWLVTDLTRHHDIVLGPAPYCYHRSGTPGKQRYHRRDWEPVYGFCCPDRLPVWSDPLAMGKPPKYGPGGDMTNRSKDGTRAGQKPCWGRQDTITTRGVDGQLHTKKAKRYRQPEIANPGNVIRCCVGKGHMGNDLAHEGEAPYPESLCDFLIRSYCPPGGSVLDPFSGSGTTVAAAVKAGRNGIGFDIRPDQVELGMARLQGISRQQWLACKGPAQPQQS